ncbi:hypothetical protein M413DRAFT_388807 [Hebeloma cylindrosporum]|uniref:Uncharacterized protein n=1 Tax=Hebeloma cylindrosporum TaxID=76867 RepID=A0A0C2YRY3_HEBCY|nr:hypothetical protein M413DRAFT_388807 [Hebeloma cylindrosporum h7]
MLLTPFFRPSGNLHPLRVPQPTGVRQILVNPRPGPRSIPAPRVSLAELTKTLGEQSGGQGLHTHDGTKQPPPTPKVPLSERKDSAPIPSPQFPGSTQQRAASTHLLPLRQVASLPGNTVSRVISISIFASKI